MSTNGTVTVSFSGNASVSGVAQAGAVITVTQTDNTGASTTLPTLTSDVNGNYSGSSTVPVPTVVNTPVVYTYEATSPAVAGAYGAGDSGPQTVDITVPTLVLTLILTASGAVTVSATAKV